MYSHLKLGDEKPAWRKGTLCKGVVGEKAMSRRIDCEMFLGGVNEAGKAGLI